ncbi:MAG: signal peptide prediction [Burkholderiaceae bacterium]
MVDAGDDLIVIPPRPSALQKLLRMLALLAGILWALPLTLVGLLLALPVVACGGEVRLVRSTRAPALLFSGRAADYMLERHPFGAMCAMAIGHVVIAERSSLTRRILTHELAHVRQAACWGILFPFVYLGASGWALLRGQDAYWNNVFEIAARKAERHA